MRVVAILQARMSSSRLPGKVLADVAGMPMLIRVVRRVEKAQHVDHVVVATSNHPLDDPIAALCDRERVSCFRGSLDDVLARYCDAAEAYNADVVVRVTGDCPLIDPRVIDSTVERFWEAQVDYASNLMPRLTFPDGLDVEVFTAAALELASREAKKPSEREHVTPYLRHAGKFRTAGIEASADLSGHRWTVDEPADLEFVRVIYELLDGLSDFTMDDVLQLLSERPELAEYLRTTVTTNEGYYRSLFTQADEGPAPRRPIVESEALLRRSRNVIPGGAQTFSKSHNQHVRGVAPIFLRRGKGALVWDVDGNEYIDYIQALLPNILGYAHDDVNAAAVAQLAQGHSFSLPHELEVELAERLVRIIPCAEMVRFCKNGSDATSGAVRVARAFTGRDRIACCGYHGWQDWYIGTTTRTAGVPATVRALTHPFAYNDIPSLERVLDEHPSEFAAIIMEPVNFVQPAPGYLQQVKDLAHKHGTLLIFDEICTGFHLGLGGAQAKFGVTPDLACFGKAMGNGFPIACVCGRSDVMEVFAQVFFSFTFGGEVASIAAALKVLDILETTDTLSSMAAHGRTLQDGFNALAKSAGLHPRFECVGFPAWSLLKFRDAEGKDSYLERSLFAQEAVKRGVLLLATHNMSAAHDGLVIERTLEAYAAVLKTLAGWLADSEPIRHLEGSMIEPVFRIR